jgi:hypothetical protein
MSAVESDNPPTAEQVGAFLIPHGGFAELHDQNSSLFEMDYGLGSVYFHSGPEKALRVVYRESKKKPGASISAYQYGCPGPETVQSLDYEDWIKNG